jgi:two-component system sensor histidine kinase QseC
MKIKSIRKYILIYLGITISFFSSCLIIFSNYYLDQKDIQQHLDSLMVISALNFNATVETFDQKELKQIQKKFDNIHELYEQDFAHIHYTPFSIKQHFKNFNFQILDEHGKRMISSSDLPLFPLHIIQKQGFHNIHIGQTDWRIFVAKHPKLNIFIILSEKLENRSELIKKITIHDLIILFFIFPITAILIWATVTRSLSPLKQITNEVKRRDPFNLDPLNVKHTPDEILPLVNEINQLLQRLKNALSREQAFAADAAHELRTPLAAIKTLSQSGINHEPDEAIHQILDKISQNVDRGSHVVQQLMNMSKTMPEANVVANFKPIDLVKITRETLAMLVHDAFNKNMEIEFESDEKISMIQGSAIAIEIMIRNLIDNAIRYGFKNTKISVRIFEEDQKITLEIQDQGPGIPLNQQQKVFERFFRAHGPKFQGTGLGLAIVKQIASLHRAEITFDNTKNKKGLTIQIHFPLNT